FSFEFSFINFTFFSGSHNVNFIGYFNIIFHLNYLSSFWGSLYLTVLKGEASILIDISEAKNGKKEVTLYKCRELEIGKFILNEKTQEPIFQVLNNSELKGQKELSLRCLSNDEKILF
ncbi:MAG: hypothetical protein M3405_11910, partial [Acidobacteriota bacterium]|nr:hypothetical protein [Acidobacteriota bacterium]